MSIIRNVLTEIEPLIGGALFVGLLVLLFTAIPARIAEHFGMPSDWAFILNWSLPLILLFLVIAAVLVTRWFGQVRRSARPRQD